MAAAPDYCLDVPLAASPELALVDAELATELRRRLRLPSDEPGARDASTYEAWPLPEPTLADDPIIEANEVDGLSLPADWPTTAAGTFEEAATTDDLIIFPNEEMSAALLSAAVEIDDTVVESASVHEVSFDHPTNSDEQQDAGSHYPALPTVDARMTEETDAALRRIREQLAADEMSTSPRRIRRGFTVASALVAALALAGFTAAVQLGFAHLPALVLH